MNEDDDTGGTAPCYGEQIVGGHAVDPATARDVARFRRAERERLLAARRVPSQEREQATANLVAGLERVLTPAPGMRIAVYWPIRGEPDLRAWMATAHDAGARVLLPVVVEKEQPLEFHAWSPRCEMTRGFWNIPVPAGGSPERPDIVISPLLGVDEALFRLGNGGGYYDRTLAALEPPPHVIGVGLAGCELQTIFPMPWDIPMDEVILSDGRHLAR